MGSYSKVLSHNQLLEVLSLSKAATAIYTSEQIVIEMANDAMIAFWGKDRSVIGKPLEDAVPELKGQPFINMLKNVLLTGITDKGDAIPAETIRDGKLQTAYYAYEYRAIKNESGIPYCILHTASDVTDMVNAKKAIQETELQREALDQEQILIAVKEEQQKNDFISMVSHELKTPLTSISAYIQLMQNRHLSDPFVVSTLDKVQKQIRKMSSMIGSFLNVSRLESGKIHLNLSHFDLDKLISDVVEDLRLIHSTNQITFVEGESKLIHADKDKIGSVISNLISNAVKYSDWSSTVLVQSVTRGNKVCVSVSDHGIGIQAHDMEKLFDRFYRVENQQTKTISGFGIGLYLSAEIINLHHGKIWVESNYGVGSTFHFSLPIKP
ncbi:MULTISPECIES: sensor histidine kinase [unclassified Pedobacter]|uniref:sensor histidine kinase n=1 Tax=unclassified Pedobacter TaxID=2628915 RepID=UPI00141E93FD|nr:MULTISPECIES: PAS domain-containing sensor histidine kinase [unclassified Pedobacter]NII82399.1 signal transduction histidine kinase [Pedobacter sp. SG908]NMN36425.1 signal transduction histidine kinase [Pedobacter sp. SG918]